MRVTPLPLAYCPIFALRSAYRFFGPAYTAYRLTTKQPFLAFPFPEKSNDSMLQVHVQSFLQTLALMCLLVKFSSFRPPKINV